MFMILLFLMLSMSTAFSFAHYNHSRMELKNIKNINALTSQNDSCNYICHLSHVTFDVLVVELFLPLENH